MGTDTCGILCAPQMRPISQTDPDERVHPEEVLAHAQAGTPVLEDQAGQAPDPEGTAGKDEGKMMLKLLAKEVHQNAVEHGFYDGGEPPFTEILADCHSELSEAREEQRSGKPMEYKREDGKPCGVAVEMVDCMLRILDWFGHNGLDVDRILIEKHAYNRTRPYLHGKQPASAEQNAKMANETLAAIKAETEAMEQGMVPDMNEPLYRKYPPFNPVALTDEKIPEGVKVEMLEWGKIGDQPIVRYEEVGPSIAWERYNKGLEVWKGNGITWIKMMRMDDEASTPYQWFMEEYERGWRYRVRNRNA